MDPNDLHAYLPERDRVLEEYQLMQGRLDEGEDPRAAVLAFGEWMVSELGDEGQALLREQMEAKDVFARMQSHFKAVADLMNSEPPLYPTENLDKISNAHERLIRNTLGLWHEGTILFARGAYARAAFLAITAIEEAGKGGVAIHHALAWHAMHRKAPDTARSRRSPLYSHRKKHQMAAAAGAVINTRLDRLLGTARVLEFIEEVENGDLSALREACLYVDQSGDGLVVPDQAVDKEAALTYLVLAGEIAAEILAVAPENFTAMLKMLDEFEAEQGIG